MRWINSNYCDECVDYFGAENELCNWEMADDVAYLGSCQEMIGLKNI